MIFPADYELYECTYVWPQTRHVPDSTTFLKLRDRRTHDRLAVAADVSMTTGAMGTLSSWDGAGRGGTGTHSTHLRTENPKEGRQNRVF